MLFRSQADDIFNRQGYPEFFKAISVSPQMTDVVSVSRLDIGGKPTATAFALCFKSCYYLVLSSYENNELALYSPGRAHLCDMVRSAVERRYERFDFTIGDEPYKRDWCETEQQLFDHSAAVTLRGIPPAAAALAWGRAKRAIKHSALLWGIAQRLRAAKAGLSKPSAGADD